MRLIATLLSLLLASPAAHSIEAAADGSWVPVVEFQFEDADFSHTLNWVSGWSFALTAVAREQSDNNGERLFCPTDRGNVQSRVMLTILNDRFKGQRITAQQASEALWSGLKAAYPCPPNEAG
jgi:hypothetical protein